MMKKIAQLEDFETLYFWVSKIEWLLLSSTTQKICGEAIENVSIKRRRDCESVSEK